MEGRKPRPESQGSLRERDGSSAAKARGAPPVPIPSRFRGWQSFSDDAMHDDVEYGWYVGHANDNKSPLHTPFDRISRYPKSSKYPDSDRDVHHRSAATSLALIPPPMSVRLDVHLMIITEAHEPYTVSPFLYMLHRRCSSTLIP